jgi:hypothetical protein
MSRHNRQRWSRALCVGKITTKGPPADRVETASALFTATNISGFALLHQAAARGVRKPSEKGFLADRGSGRGLPWANQYSLPDSQG